MSYKLAFTILCACFGVWMFVGQFMPYFQGMLLTSVEIAYECKSQGKSLKDCERDVREALR
jgi:hypothetical protein